jgi:hypothetical protein
MDASVVRGPPRDHQADQCRFDVDVRSGAPLIDTRMYYRTDVYALVVVRTVPS